MLTGQQNDLIKKFNQNNKGVTIERLSDLLSINDMKKSYHLYKNTVKNMPSNELLDGLFSDSLLTGCDACDFFIYYYFEILSHRLEIMTDLDTYLDDISTFNNKKDVIKEINYMGFDFTTAYRISKNNLIIKFDIIGANNGIEWLDYYSQQTDASKSIKKLVKQLKGMK